jgi:HK97 family phage major capsid protein
MGEHIISLRRQVAAARAAMETINAAAADKPLTPEQQKEWDGHKATIVALKTRLEDSETHEREMASTAAATGSILEPGKSTISTVERPWPKEKGIAAARLVFATAKAKLLGGDALQHYVQHWGEDAVVADIKNRRTAAMAADSLAGGGVLISDQATREIIELLVPKVIVRKLGPTIWPMVNGVAEVPRVNSNATASYIGENVDATASQPGTGMLTLTAKKLAALVPISNNLIRFAVANVDKLIVDLIVLAIKAKEDIAFIRGDGTSGTPKGMLNWCDSANALTMTALDATYPFKTVMSDLGRLRKALIAANVPMNNPAWLMSPRTETFLMTLLNNIGARMFPEMDEGKLLQWQYAYSTQIPENLGVSANASELYLADMSEVVIAESTDLLVDASQEAAYKDASGTMTSAFGQDQTVVRVIEQHDLGLRHDKSVATLNGLTWGT